MNSGIKASLKLYLLHLIFSFYNDCSLIKKIAKDNIFSVSAIHARMLECPGGIRWKGISNVISTM